MTGNPLYQAKIYSGIFFLFFFLLLSSPGLSIYIIRVVGYSTFILHLKQVSIINPIVHTDLLLAPQSQNYKV